MIMQNQNCEISINPTSLLELARVKFDRGEMTQDKYELIKLQYDRMVKERMIKDFKSILF